MAFPLWREARRIRLDFVAGAHKGASEELAPGLWSIGGAPDSQIRLGDPALADTRLTLDSGHLLGPRLRLEAGAAALEGDALPLGVWRRAPRDAQVTLGREVFELSRKPMFGHSQAIAPLAAGALGLAALAMGSGVTGAPSPVQPDPTRQIAQMAQGRVAEGAARELQARLNAAGAGVLRAQGDSANGRVQVSGPMTEGLRPLWEAERLWFDSAYGARLALSERFGAAATPAAEPPPPAEVTLPFAIRSAWTSPQPLIILQDGSRNRPGDVLPGGWRFVGLQDGDLHLERGGQIVAIAP
ncbi:hypothetical protein [Neomegalonema sp.]|uniref:SctD/MshK family protein n=1 Tax=Neomegalonema sp. TaxID=2039713 RepID=UPI0026169F0E|nr:hypothetical protein [Neomegalonema sp.]MDD2868163.1 hypothetical protein [Neomegalonema sp.]